MERKVLVKKVWQIGIQLLPNADELEVFANALLEDLSDYLKMNLYPYHIFISPSNGKTSGSIYYRFRSDTQLNIFQIQIEGVLCLSHKISKKPSIFSELMFFSLKQRITTYKPYNKNNITLNDPVFLIEYQEKDEETGQWIAKGWIDGDGALENIITPRDSLYESYIKIIDN